MKKSTTIAFVLIFSVLTTAYALPFQKKDPHAKTINNPAGITYIVEVNLANPSYLCGNYQVLISNANGIPVCAPITYQEGIINYVFHESGPVNETRVAQFIELSGPNQVACDNTVYTQPHSLTRNFSSGSTYLFHLEPEVLPGND